jgi:glycosyl-4,4'-diaponeurosporenoate acyltransferase
MRIDLPIAWMIALNVLGWPIIQIALAWGFTRLPLSFFIARPVWNWESDGHVYEARMRIKSWKDLLPDGANWFSGGFPKATLAGRDRAYLARFNRETWRGELCHWLAIACTPLFFLWNPWWADLVMVGYSLTANLPCIFVQRYNRARINRLLLTPGRRSIT